MAPKKGDINPKAVFSVTVECAKDGAERKKAAITCTLYEARSDEAKILLQLKLFHLKDY